MSDKEVEFADLVTKEPKSAGSETKQFPALLSVKSIDKQARRITAIASTGNLDRDGEIIEPEAFRESLPIFMKNPVVLAAHQHLLDDGRSPVVANVVSASVTKGGLEVSLEFHNLTAIAEEYWQLYSQKKQRALSVGYISIEGGYEQRNGKSVFVHKKVELVEISLCPVPSNREALTRSKQRKLDFISDKKQQREEIELEKIFDEFETEHPDFEAECEEYAEMILGVKAADIKGEDNIFDYDEGVDEFAKLVDSSFSSRLF